jgi:hypothetical protein
MLSPRMLSRGGSCASAELVKKKRGPPDVASGRPLSHQTTVLRLVVE